MHTLARKIPRLLGLFVLRRQGVKSPYSAVVAGGAELSVIGGTFEIGENTFIGIEVIL